MTCSYSLLPQPQLVLSPMSSWGASLRKGWSSTEVLLVERCDEDWFSKSFDGIVVNALQLAAGRWWKNAQVFFSHKSFSDAEIHQLGSIFNWQESCSVKHWSKILYGVCSLLACGSRCMCLVNQLGFSSLVETCDSLSRLFAMSGEEDEGSGDGRAEGHPRIKISTVQRVQLAGRKVIWYPETQEYEGACFATFSKWDATLVKLVMGKGMNRHRSRQRNDLHCEWWNFVRNLRRLHV